MRYMTISAESTDLEYLLNKYAKLGWVLITVLPAVSGSFTVVMQHD